MPYRIDGKHGRSYNVYRVKRKTSRSIGRKRRTFKTYTAAKHAGYRKKYVVVKKRRVVRRVKRRSYSAYFVKGRRVSTGRRFHKKTKTVKRSVLAQLTGKKKTRKTRVKRRGLGHCSPGCKPASYYTDLNGGSHMYRQFWG